MGCNAQALERKLEKPDWRQWLPIKGAFNIREDLANDKPTILGEKSGSLRELAVGHYHWAVSIVAPAVGVGYGLYHLARILN